MNHAPRWIGSLLALLIGVVGCGGGGPTTYSVSGNVTYQGKPVADAQVGFVPTDQSIDVKPAQGLTDSAGRYTLSTYLGPGDNAGGATAGKFKVTISKGLPQNKIVTYDELKNFKSEIPVEYSDAAKTPLSAEVTSSGGNQFDFALEDQTAP